MRFGVHLPTYWTDYGTSNIRVAIEEAAKAAEALGYAAIWVDDVVVVPSDHHSITSLNHSYPSHAGPPRAKHKTWHLRTRAATTKRHDCGQTGGSPGLAPESRLILGVGVGWRAEEFKI